MSYKICLEYRVVNIECDPYPHWARKVVQEVKALSIQPEKCSFEKKTDLSLIFELRNRKRNGNYIYTKYQAQQVAEDLISELEGNLYFKEHLALVDFRAWEPSD